MKDTPNKAESGTKSDEHPAAADDDSDAGPEAPSNISSDEAAAISRSDDSPA